MSGRGCAASWATRDATTMLDAAAQLGMSVPAMAQKCLRLIEGPVVYAQHPRASRIIAERVQQGRGRR